MQTVGLTGGIGSGKSTVAKILADEGIPLIDADALSRSLTQTGGAAMVAIEEVFGKNVIAQEGGLNREAMRTLMLENSQAKARLEAIIHPLIGQQINEQLAHAQASGAILVVVDIPLLVEGGLRWRSRLDAIWVVDCLPATQIERVKVRNGWSLAQIEGVMAAQANREQRLACADAVISNEGIGLAQLSEQVMTLLNLQNLATSV